MSERPAIFGTQNTRPNLCRSGLRLWRDESGVVLIYISLIMPILIGFTALGAEVGYWYVAKREMQSAADSAAISGAISLANDVTSQYATQAIYVAGQNGFQNGVKNVTVTVHNPPSTGNLTSNTSAVEVLISKPLSTLLSDYWLPSVTISARAVASITTSGGDCLLALDSSSDSKAFTSSGSAIVTLNTCGIAINSSNASDAMDLSGSTIVSTQSLSIVGGTNISGGAKLTSTDGTTKITTTIANPYSKRVMPSPSLPCSPANTSKNVSSSATLQSGTYCNGLAISGGTVTMSAGTYIIYQGTFAVSGSAHVTANNVNIVLTGASGNYATAQISGGTVLNLTAASTGPLAGIAFYQDPNTPSNTSASNFSGSSGTTILGALVFPTTTVVYSGGTSTASTCLQLVAWKVNFSGSATFNNNCSGTGVSPIGASSFASLSE